MEKLTLEKKQEEWDKEIPKVSLFRVLALNAKEWWIIVLGVFGSIINGSIFPLFGIIFGEILAVFARPTGGEILNGIGPWAGLFVVLGFVAGVAIFLKVGGFSRQLYAYSKPLSLSFRLCVSPLPGRVSHAAFGLSSSVASSGRKLAGMTKNATPLEL